MNTQNKELIESFQAFRKNHATVFAEGVQRMLLTVEESLSGDNLNQQANKKPEKKNTHKLLVETILNM